MSTLCLFYQHEILADHLVSGFRNRIFLLLHFWDQTDIFGKREKNRWSKMPFGPQQWERSKLLTLAAIPAVSVGRAKGSFFRFEEKRRRILKERRNRIGA